MSIYNYEQAFGALDKTSGAMRKAIERWFGMYYDSTATDSADACQRIPYTVVNKLVKSVFGEYKATADTPLGQNILKDLDEKKRLAMQLALVGGSCYIKPCPVGAGFSFTLVPRNRVLIFATDAAGRPTDIGLVEKCAEGNSYYTLLERRTVDAGGYLTIRYKLYRSQDSRNLGAEVPLKNVPAYSDLAESYCFQKPVGSVGLVTMKLPMLNCVDGSYDGVAVYAPAEGLIRNIDRNEAQMNGEFSRGESRVFASRDLLDSNDYSWSISIGGQSIPISHFDFDLSSNFTTQTIASGVLTVKHNADGTLDMPYSVSVPNVQNWNSYGPPAMSLSGTWALSRIPRAAIVFCPDGIVGKTVNVTVSSVQAGLTHTLSYSFGDLSGIIAEKTAAEVTPWTIPENFYGQLPNEKEGVCVITCTTYSGDMAVGASQCKCFVSVDGSVCAPVLSGDVADANSVTVALTGDARQLVRYCSHAQVTAAYQAKNGAAIESYTMTHNGTVYTESPVTVCGVEKGEFRFNVTDSRGYNTSLTVTKTVIPYIRLTCNLSDNKPDGDGNMTVKVSGSYFNGSFGAQSNTLTVEYRYKESGGSYGDWIPMTVTPGVRTYNAAAELAGLDYKTAYVFQARATDKLAVVDSAEYAARATPVFDWDENDFNVNGTFKINNEAVTDFVVARGNTGIWTWEKWNSGVAKCWGQTAERQFAFLGDGPLYYSDTVYSFSYPFALTTVDCVSANIVAEEGCVVPVVLSVKDSVRTSFVRFCGGDGVTGHYTFSVMGRWK